MQRFFDILFSSIALFLLAPLLLPIGLLLLFTGEGEVFFIQDRIGKNGEIFKLLKFATMLKNSPNMGTGTLTVKYDPRVLPIGKVLRKTKINELPQLINIFTGDMSLVGPRPMTKQTFEIYSVRTQECIKKVRPGLSGVGSIIFRGEEDILAGDVGSLDFYKNVIAPYKGELEKWYVAHRSIKVYFAAIFATIIVVLNSKSQVAWKLFPNLPIPPENLKWILNYPV